MIWHDDESRNGQGQWYIPGKTRLTRRGEIVFVLAAITLVLILVWCAIAFGAWITGTTDIPG